MAPVRPLSGHGFRAYKADLAEVERESAGFAARYRGHLASLAGGADGSNALFEAVREYEKIEDRLGRIISYAGLIYATDTTNPAHGKFYSDAQERVTTISSDLLFFTLELNGWMMQWWIASARPRRWIIMRRG